MIYGIGKFSEITGFNAPTLRYYEQEGLIIVERDACGRRFYTDKDIEWVQFIRRLKEMGMKIKNIQEYARLRYMGDSTIKQCLAILLEHKTAVLAEKKKWENNLQQLELKIGIYKKSLSKEHLGEP
jgi:DNA-binding transcriptional MerR regulator